VDSLKTELIADRVWQTNAQLEIAIVEYVAWFNTRRLHSSLGNIPPVEHEQGYAATQLTDVGERSAADALPLDLDHGGAGGAAVKVAGSLSLASLGDSPHRPAQCSAEVQ